jgi:hypothetical protein
LHYRCFDKPLFDRARKEGYDAVEKQLAEIAANPDLLSQHEVIRALVDCPQPLVGLLLSRFDGANESMRKLMLEVIALRYYRIRALENFQSFTADGRSYVSAEYEHKGNRVHLFASRTEYSKWLALGTRMGRARCSTLPSGPLTPIHMPNRHCFVASTR